jgi:hypothetical protein
MSKWRIMSWKEYRGYLREDLPLIACFAIIFALFLVILLKT